MPLPILPILAGGASLASSIFGHASAAKQMKKANQVTENEIADLTSWRDMEKNRDFLKSNVGRSVMERALEFARDKTKTIDSSSAVTGASNEAQLAEKQGVQKGLSGIMSNLASYATARKDSIENQYRSNITNLMGHKRDMHLARAQSGSNLATNASDFFQGLIPLFSDMEGSEKTNKS